MTTTVAERHASAADVCARYQQVLGLPATVVPDTQRVTVATQAGVLGAVVMPSDLGQVVLAHIPKPWGPVIEHPWSRRWAFLTATESADHDGGHVAARLFSLGVFLAVRVVLPSPSDAGFRRWIWEPVQDRRPALSLVVDLARGVR